MQRLKNTIRSFALAIAAAFFILLVIEISLRLIPQGRLQNIFGDFANRDVYQNNKASGYCLKPNLSTIFEGHRLITNSRGLRDREYNANEKTDLKILALGDSFTFGEGVEMEETYAKVLERILKEQYTGKNIEVINIGVPGYGNDQELRVLKKDGKYYKPDLVLVGFYVGNDFLDNQIGGVKRRRVKDNGFLYDIYIENKIDEDLKKKFPALLFCHINRYLKEKSLTCFLIKSRIENLLWKWGISEFYSQYAILDMENFPYFENPLPEKYKKGFELTVSIIKEIKKESEKLGAGVVVVLIPAGFQVYEASFDGLMTEYHLNKRNYNMESLNSLLAERLNSDGIMVIDLLPKLRQEAKSDNGLYSWGHWRSKAHRIAAEEIYRFMEASRIIF